MPDKDNLLLTEKPKQKFKVGQIVVMKSLKREMPFRIMGIIWAGGWFYQWNNKNRASENMLRELTIDEIGETAIEQAKQEVDDKAIKAFCDVCYKGNKDICGSKHCWEMANFIQALKESK